MEGFPSEIFERYLEQHSSNEDPVLAELTRHTYQREVNPRMLSGHVMGRFLSLFSSLLGPSLILEIGTYTGYSAICLARGLKKGGRLITLEVNEELRDTALSFFKKAGVADRIQLVSGDALKIIPELDDRFDLVFIDAQKEDYLAYYDLVFDKVRKGGYILADNVLWGGKVLAGTTEDTSTKAIQLFNRRITDDQRVENLLLPIRDGIMVIRKL
jgi:caffeoyl-CoA O-methyltransferase